MKTCISALAAAFVIAVLAPSRSSAQQVISGACLHDEKAAAGAVHDRLRKSLVHLQATALHAQTGVEMQTDATGFFISSNGELLTVYHLYRKLGDFKVETLKVTASLRSKEGQRRSVVREPVDHDQGRDLLKLRLTDVGDLQPGEIAPVCFVSASELEHVRKENRLVGGNLMTSGFPNNQPYITDRGTLAALEGHSHMWTVTGMAFVEGQSGSPIYLDDGRVIGLVKGTDTTAANQQYIIPTSRIPFLVPRLLEAQSQWEMRQRIAQRSAGRGVKAETVKVETSQVCLSMLTANSPSILRVMLKQHEGSPAGDCIQARLDELTATAPEVIKAAAGTGSGLVVRDARPDQRAREIVEQITKAIGIPVTFKVRLTNEFHNAATMKDDNGEKVILLNPEFLAELEKGSNSAALAVLAHEIGHIIAGHLDGNFNDPAQHIRMELEADHFAGFIQAKLGVSLKEATAYFQTLPDVPSTTHPPRKERIAIVERGWYAGRGSIIADLKN